MVAVPERQFAHQTRGCFGWGLGDLGSKHCCTLTSLRDMREKISVTSELGEEF
jgi:hypothetical protein